MGWCNGANGGKGGECPHKGTKEQTKGMCVGLTCPGWSDDRPKK